MDKRNNEKAYNHYKNSNTAKVLYIGNYAKKSKKVQNTPVATTETDVKSTRGKVLYFDGDRQKTLDLFAKVLHTMKKESFQ